MMLRSLFLVTNLIPKRVRHLDMEPRNAFLIFQLTKQCQRFIPAFHASASFPNPPLNIAKPLRYASLLFKIAFFLIKKFKGVLQVRDSLTVSVYLLGSFTSLQEVIKCLLFVAALQEMIRKFAQMLINILGVSLL